MFDIGFWELAVIGVVALLVVGPEQLPRLARTAGLWAGRARRFVGSVKADIDRELAADELKKSLAKQADSEGLYDIIEETKRSISPHRGDTHTGNEHKPGATLADTSADTSADKPDDRNG